MPKLLQINICSNVLSTGKVCEDIAKVTQANGWQNFIAYGRIANPGICTEIRVGSMYYTYEHYIEHRLLDREGLASRFHTRKLIKQINEIKPDIIHLHNIHDHYLNYPILFKYLASTEIPIVWTQHDCWAFTGGCMYFDISGCEHWKNGCLLCKERRALFANLAAKQFAFKKDLFNKVKNLTFVPVSDWLHGLLKKSSQRNRPIITIHNGIDLTMFKPLCKKKKDSKFKILGVASVWDRRKGLDDFVKLRSMLSDDFEIILVGLSRKQIKKMPDEIKCFTRTQNVEELVRFYSDADVFVNPTYSDNFPTTNIEALACGTPVITYRTGGSPEAIDEKTGIIIRQGDIQALSEAICKMKETPLLADNCRKRAEKYFDKDKCFSEYIKLYESLLLG